VGIIELVDRVAVKTANARPTRKYSLVEILKFFIIAKNQPLEETLRLIPNALGDVNNG
jgi:hypothetical protein